jgi:hypothetical protein
VGDEVRISIGGIGGAQTREGWVGLSESFYFDATGTAFEDAEVEDGWYIVLDPAEGES